MHVIVPCIDQDISEQKFVIFAFPKLMNRYETTFALDMKGTLRVGCLFTHKRVITQGHNIHKSSKLVNIAINKTDSLILLVLKHISICDYDMRTTIETKDGIYAM